jgi:hypothetical protein
MSADTMELMWLAGWFDGHGVISIGKTRRQSAVRLDGSSCDRSIVERVRAIAGGNLQTRPTDARGQRADPNSMAKYGYRNGGLRQRLFRWQLCGEKAAVLLQTLMPLMVSETRREKAAAAIENFESRKPVVAKSINNGQKL